MDDTAQNQTDTNVQPAGQSPLGGTSQPQPQTQVTPVGSANKEIGVSSVNDSIRASEAAVIKDREVSDAGVIEVEKEIKLEKVHEKMGVRLSAESTPVKTEPTGMVQLPMDEKEVDKVIKKGPGNFNLPKFFEGIFFADSIYGFAILMAKHLKRIHKKLIGQPV
jgi:hypothetical protein